MLLCELDVKQERQHSQLIQGVENFKPERLKRTNTQEKMVLPNAEGKYHWFASYLIGGGVRSFYPHSRYLYLLPQ